MRYKVKTSAHKEVYRLYKKGRLGFYNYVCAFVCSSKKLYDIKEAAIREIEYRVTAPGKTIMVFDYESE